MKFHDYYPTKDVKIMPEDLAGMIGLPSIGNVYYVDPGAGSDTANSGTSRNNAFATVYKAQATMTADQDDVCIIAGSSSTGRTTEATAIDWNKRRTHLIGNAAPTYSSMRAGMNFTATAQTTTPQFVVSANGCMFINLALQQGVADSYVMCSLTGDYNYFQNVHFGGIGHTTAGDEANACSITMTGVSENTFDNCLFGLDTVLRTGANATIRMVSNNGKNLFRNCHFTLFADADAPFHINTDLGGSAISRHCTFENCYFNDNSDVTSGIQQTDCLKMDTAGDLGGAFIMHNCMNVSSTGWASDVTGIRMLGDQSNDTLATGYCTGVNPGA